VGVGEALASASNETSAGVAWAPLVRGVRQAAVSDAAAMAIE
jgi:hypothetical protein